jgi:surface polysaccharide O-acyltransferase-like enzyme
MRKDYIDWLRNIAIFYLFPYHTARIFDALNSFYVKGAINIPSTNLVYVSFWFMPLMFLLAGYSSFYALQKRSGKTYIKERFLRLFIPFVFGVIIIVPPQAYYAKMFHLNLQENYFIFLKKYFTCFSNWSEYAGGISPAHLWFILFLFIISIVMLPVMKFIIKKQIKPEWMENPFIVSMAFIVLAILSILPDISGKNIFLYCGYFMIGFLFALNDKILDNIEKYCNIFGLLMLLGIAGLFIEKYFFGTLFSIPYRFIRYLIYWITLITILGYGKKYLNKNTKTLMYFNKAAFPIYMLHQTVLVIVGYYVLKIINHGIVPYILILIITFIVTILMYEIISKIKILKIMFGIK